MTQTAKQPTCKELVRDEFNQVEQDYQDAQKYFDKLYLLSGNEQEQYKTKDKYNKFFYCEDLFDYVNNTALSWDYVEAGTFEDQEEGYYRLQLSWGGPSDEFRIYTTQYADEIDVIEYWYMDWFDGASINVPVKSTSWDVCQMFLDCEVA